MSAPVRVLVVRLSAIGDVVHALPVLPALHEAGLEAAWLVEPAAAPLLEGHPLLRAVVRTTPARRFRLAEAWPALIALRAVRCDTALELQGLWKSAAWARLSGARRVIGWTGPARREPSSRVLLSQGVAAQPDAVHVIDRNLALLRALGIEAVGRRRFVFPEAPGEVQAVAGQIAERGLRDIALVNPGGGWASKLWPAERHGELARGLRARGLTPLVTWGPGEEDLADRVVAASGGAAVRGFPTRLLGLVELARRARLMVAADTGPLHLACAAGTPAVALFGPTSPSRNGPFDPADEVVRAVPPCAPCYSRTCVRHLGVMERITVGEVLAAVDRRLARAARGHAAL